MESAVAKGAKHLTGCGEAQFSSQFLDDREGKPVDGDKVKSTVQVQGTLRLTRKILFLVSKLRSFSSRQEEKTEA